MPNLADLIGGPFGPRYMDPSLSQKGVGFYGPLERPDGDISTELSFDFDHGGKSIAAPLLVPTLNRAEINHLLAGREPTEAIYQKAQNFALERLMQGKPTFARPNEIVPLPEMRLQDVVNSATGAAPLPSLLPPPAGGVRG